MANQEHRVIPPPGTLNLTEKCGTLTGARFHYQRGEGACVECRRVKSRDHQMRKVRVLNSLPPSDLVPVDSLRSEVESVLSQEGIAASQLGDLLGIPHHHLYRLLRPSTKRMKAETVSLIRDRVRSGYQVPLEDLPPKLTRTPIGTRRRLLSLVALGYPLAYLGEVSGVSTTTLFRIKREKGVSVRSVRRFDRFYRDFQHTWAKDNPEFLQKYHIRALSLARKASREAYIQKWAPPAGWDGKDMDDPSAKPEGVRWESLVY